MVAQSIKNGGRCALFFLLFIILVNPVYANIRIENSTHSPGRVCFTIFNGNAPYKIYKSLDKQNWTLQCKINSNVYEEFGLENGITYYYKVVDSSNDEYIGTYTAPFVNIEYYPLQVVQFGNDYIHLNFNSYYDKVDLYVNNKFYRTCSENAITLTDLIPNTEYIIYFLNSSEQKSNVIRITTLDYNGFLGQLNQMLSELFISTTFKVDSNNDGVVDALEGIHRSIEDIKNNKLIGLSNRFSEFTKSKSAEININNLKDVKSDETFDFKINNVNSNLDTDLAKMFDFNLIDTLMNFEKEIILIRKILVCSLYSSLIFTFIRKIVPKLSL